MIPLLKMLVSLRSIPFLVIILVMAACIASQALFMPFMLPVAPTLMLEILVLLAALAVGATCSAILYQPADRKH